MFFIDRVDAGQALAAALQEYAHQTDTIVIALPRGGVVVGYEVAKALQIPLDIVCPRKIASPLNPEYALGAITETGEGVIFEDFPTNDLQTIIDRERKVAQWRLNHYRKGMPPRMVEDRSVILVDDGLATGSTMRAAIKTIRSEKARQITVAIPLSPKETLENLKAEVDKIICLKTPSPFFAVGQFYQHFDQTTDEEVISLLKKARSHYV